MAGITFVLRVPSAKTPQPINCIVRVGESDRAKFSTYFKVLPSNWDAKKLRVKNVLAEKDKDLINRTLQGIEDEFNRLSLKMVAERTVITKEFLKSHFEEFLRHKEPEQPAPVPTETPTQVFFRMIDEFITDSESGKRKNHDGGKLSPRSIQRYKPVKTRLEEFANTYDRELSLQNIDEIFYMDFVKWMEEVKIYSKNTIGKYIVTLKSMMNNAVEEGLIEKLPYRNKNFKPTSEDSDNIYLTIAELDKLQALDLSSNQRLERVRDFFLVGCYTGFRYSDLSQIRQYNFKSEEDGTKFIELIQEKTKDPVTVQVLPVVQTIFEKYNYQLPNITNQKVNDYIKEVCQLAEFNEPVYKQITKGGKRITINFEKWELVTTHTARRSFATNAYKRGANALEIMAVTGHKTEKSFAKYIKLNNKEKAKRIGLVFAETQTEKPIIKVLTA